MASFSRILLGPLYRLMYGRPLDDRLPSPHEDPSGTHDHRQELARPVAGEAGAEARRGGLVLVADGVGGLDLCGTALRYVLGAERLPYAFQLFPWGHGFGRWYSDLTN